ncbi:urate oxidase [Galdieria sulphuraria]|uniref:Uricase n=1 Tax=Galdieria sulphuraria TaxID=130081 RepID=M2X7H9_GALSU|nr:urate oxidase [Galdieria sulphuraria]EME25777.1 urate oxidase [Galdieria sulphuraria]|eukprot:XP_005702297.1 urate oxidase [Galdieria sulphuraria]
MLKQFSHGKTRVRVAKKKVSRPSATYTKLFQEFMIEVSLEGGTEDSFLRGDNTQVVATDTCKNIVYWVAKQHSCETAENLALEIGCFFLKQYTFLQSVNVRIERVPWTRAIVEGKSHSHGFVRQEDECSFSNVFCSREVVGKRVKDVHDKDLKDENLYRFTLVSGIDKWKLLKTTRSGWEGFIRDQFTTLPETNERMLATECRISWTYANVFRKDLERLNFSAILSQVKETVKETFFGDSLRGIYSPGVQKTLFEIAKHVLYKIPEIDQVSLSMPNIHYLPANLEVFSNHGIAFENDIYIPTDEPHGIIHATVTRIALSKL